MSRLNTDNFQNVKKFEKENNHRKNFKKDWTWKIKNKNIKKKTDEREESIKINTSSSLIPG